MSSPDLIIETLDTWPSGICDSCLKNLTDAESHQYVNATCRNLEAKGYLERQKNERIPCGNCGKIRVLNVLITFASRPAPITVKQQTAVNTEFMDRLRRRVIQYLNSLDSATERDGFSKRVTQLRNQERLSGTVASLFLTHAAYRNAMYYKDFLPSEDESKLLIALDDCIRGYLDG